MKRPSFAEATEKRNSAFKTLEANKNQHWMLNWFSYVDRIPLLLELLGNAITKNFKGPIDSQLYGCTHVQVSHC